MKRIVYHAHGIGNRVEVPDGTGNFRPLPAHLFAKLDKQQTDTRACVYLRGRVRDAEGAAITVECPQCGKSKQELKLVEVFTCNLQDGNGNPKYGTCTPLGFGHGKQSCLNCPDKTVRRTISGAIPKLFHRVWLGADMPAEFVRYGQTWTDLHPGWEMHTWTENNLAPLRLSDCPAWQQASSYSQKSDVIRHHALLYYGGVYIDTDFECLKNIEPLLEGNTCVAGFEEENVIGSAFLAAVPSHPAIERIVALLNRGIDPGAPHTCIGPRIVTEALQGQDCKVYPSAVLYPYHWKERHRKGEKFPDAYAVHCWAQSWGDK